MKNTSIKAVCVTFFLFSFNSTAAVNPPEKGWELGLAPPNIHSYYLSGKKLRPRKTSLYSLAGRYDAVIIAVCASWCSPCITWSLEAQTFADNLAAEGIKVGLIDLLIEDYAIQPATRETTLNWLDTAWTGNPRDVWYGADSYDAGYDILSVQTPSNVWPSYVILDSNLQVHGHYVPGSSTDISDIVRQASDVTPWFGNYHRSIFARLLLRFYLATGYPIPNM